MPDMGVFSLGDARRVARATSTVEEIASGGASAGEQGTRFPWGTRCRYAILDEDLSAASDALTGATTADAHFLVSDPANPGDLIAGDDFVCVNRSVDTSAPSGTFMIVANISGEWTPIWIDCD